MIDKLNDILAAGVPSGVYAEIDKISFLSEQCQAIDLVDTEGMPLQRQNEFIAGRVLARRGLASFGINKCEIPRSNNGSPVWPEGICGSISHKQNLCVVLLADISVYRALGVDIEKEQSLPPAVWKYFITPCEYDQGIDEPFNRVSNLIFSCKEAAYKCLQPTLAIPIPFHEIEVRLIVKGPQSCKVQASFKTINLEGELYRWNDVVLAWMALQ